MAYIQAPRYIVIHDPDPRGGFATGARISGTEHRSMLQLATYTTHTILLDSITQKYIRIIMLNTHTPTRTIPRKQRGVTGMLWQAKLTTANSVPQIMQAAAHYRRKYQPAPDVCLAAHVRRIPSGTPAVLTDGTRVVLDHSIQPAHIWIVEVKS
jgi:hypothetical protein